MLRCSVDILFFCSKYIQ
uniref:Uncharacterized protein n=1 Tax=Arundo donax TaxID=35708 RepID=A0A0A8Z9X9_ARUDO